MNCLYSNNNIKQIFTRVINPQMKHMEISPKLINKIFLTKNAIKIKIPVITKLFTEIKQFFWKFFISLMTEFD